MSLRKLRIALPVAEMSLLGGQSVGIYNVALGLVRGLGSIGVELHVIASRDFIKDCRLPSESSNGGIYFTELDAPLTGWRRFLWEIHGVVKWAEKVDADWLLLPKGFAPYSRSKKVKIASYVHDLILDFYKDRYLWFLSFAQKHYFPRLLKNTLSKSHLLLTNSDFTTSELQAKYGVRANTLGIGFDQLKISSKGDNFEYDFEIYHSSAPHKLSQQVVGNMEAFEKAADRELRICCIGGTHSRWKVFSRMSEEEYERLMEKVNIVVYASEYEGFGMPPVERLLANRGVIASNIAPINEHVSTDLLFQNHDQLDFIRVASDALEYKDWRSFIRMEVRTWHEIAGDLIQMLSMEYDSEKGG